MSNKYIIVYFVVYIKGTEKIWVTGDDFGFKSFIKHYIKLSDVDRYMVDLFKVSGFMNDKKQSYDVNTLSRMRNNLIRALKEQPIPPKYLVVVLDNDLIQFGRSKAPDVKDTEELFE